MTIPTIHEVRHRHTWNTIRRCGGNLSLASRLLRVDRRSLYRNGYHGREVAKIDVRQPAHVVPLYVVVERHFRNVVRRVESPVAAARLLGVDRSTVYRYIRNGAP